MNTHEPLDPIEESRLLDRCRQGEEQAWNTLFDLHYGPAFRYVFQLSHDFTQEDAEEICQEVFLTIIRQLQSFRAESRFQTWLFRIASNRAHDFRQRQTAAKRGGTQKPLSLQATRSGNHPEADPTSPPLDPPCPQPGPDRKLEKAEDESLVGEALEHLEPSWREVVELRYFGGLSYEEIAQCLNLNPKTVSSRLSKSLRKLERITRDLVARPGPRALPSASLPPTHAPLNALS